MAVGVLGPFGLAKASVQSHQEKVAKNVEKGVGVDFLGAKEFQVSLHGWCVGFSYVVANLFPTCHFVVDNLNGRGKCFRVRFQVAGVAITAAGDECSCIEEVFFICGDP